MKKEKTHYTITVSKAVYRKLKAETKKQKMKSINAMLISVFEDAE